jgi:hypothetical protein
MPTARSIPRPTILSVSPDPGLLFSRTQILKSSGYQVIAAMNRHVAVLAAANHGVDLAILCHALDREEVEEIEHDLLIVHPGLAILQLQDYERMEVREYGLSPELLLQMVGAALTARAKR